MQYVSPIIAIKLNSIYTMFIILIRVNKQQIIAIINFSAINNFITRALVKRKEYFT